MLGGCKPPETLTLVSYNVQNLFDATESGSEYREFTLESGWNPDAYYKRLIRLGHVLNDLVEPPPDIIALQEIESPAVVSDLLRDFLRGKYHAVTPPATRSSIRVALISRFPLAEVRIHRSVAVAVAPSPSPRPPVELWEGRDMVDATIEAGTSARRRNSAMRVIVCHWKSQSGGERKTEPQRIQSAALLASLLNTSNDSLPTLIVGDFNEDVEEYAQHGGSYPTALMPAESLIQNAGGIAERPSIAVVDTTAAARRHPAGLSMFSPWLVTDRLGTYQFAGQWERLDQVLVLPGSTGGIDVGLDVVDDAELLTDDGRPLRYDSRTGYGYSDHLPVVATIRLISRD